ncbi:DUF2130 domain-containing protein [Mycoplasma sp. CR]|uniref:DUF2130 domain-containing protein n=1 Tax=Mycoplasma sp. CR TaxID=3401693 RepID=UPI003AAADA7B
MSKKINIKIKDFENLEIELLNEAKIGDYISLLDLDSNNVLILFEKYKEKNTTFITKIKEEMIKDYESDLENKPKVQKLIREKEDYYKNELFNIQTLLESKKIELAQLQQNINVHKENEANKVKEQLRDEMSQLKEKINILENEAKDANQEYSKEIFKKDNEINGYKVELSNFQDRFKTELENQKLALEKELKEQFDKNFEMKRKEILSEGQELQKDKDQAVFGQKITELNEKISTLEAEVVKFKEENNKLTQAKYMRSTKELGEDFEKSIMDSLNENFGFDKNIRFSKTTLSKNKEGKDTIAKDEGTKPDFLIEFFNPDFDKSEQVIGKIIIEAKDQASEDGKQKNSSFYKKLDNDRKNYKADVGFLVTTLEPNESYLVKNIIEYKDLIQMRFEALPQMIRIFQRLFIEKSRLNRLDINLEAKSVLLQKFEEFKKELKDFHVRLIDESIDKMLKQIDNLENSTKNLRDLVENELQGRFKRFTKKFENFSLLKEYEKAGIKDDTDVAQIEHKMKEIPNIQDADVIEEE